MDNDNTALKALADLREARAAKKKEEDNRLDQLRKEEAEKLRKARDSIAKLLAGLPFTEGIADGNRPFFEVQFPSKSVFVTYYFITVPVSHAADSYEVCRSLCIYAGFSLDSRLISLPLETFATSFAVFIDVQNLL